MTTPPSPSSTRGRAAAATLSCCRLDTAIAAPTVPRQPPFRPGSCSVAAAPTITMRGQLLTQLSLPAMLPLATYRNSLRRSCTAAAAPLFATLQQSAAVSQAVAAMQLLFPPHCAPATRRGRHHLQAAACAGYYCHVAAVDPPVNAATAHLPPYQARQPRTGTAALCPSSGYAVAIPAYCCGTESFIVSLRPTVATTRLPLSIGSHGVNASAIDHVATPTRECSWQVRQCPMLLTSRQREETPKAASIIKANKPLFLWGSHWLYLCKAAEGCVSAKQLMYGIVPAKQPIAVIQLSNMAVLRD
jgi:hypothetical protein